MPLDRDRQGGQGLDRDRHGGQGLEKDGGEGVGRTCDWPGGRYIRMVIAKSVMGGSRTPFCKRERGRNRGASVCKMVNILVSLSELTCETLRIPYM